MKKANLVDSFEISSKDVSWKIDESNTDKVVDGVNILGRAVGPFFAVNADSLNGRHYSKKLWENAINENTDRFGNGEMLGTIGHDQSLDDQALLEGKVSHKVTKLWIDESTGTGMGEVQILSTPAGKVLNSLLRGGVRLKVSSRAMGEFKGTAPSGAKMIDESSFKLEGFDFVQRPGVASAIPVLVESDNTDEENISKENEEMTQNLLESITSEKLKLQEQLADTLAKLSESNRDLDALRNKDVNAQKELVRFEENIKSKNERYDALKEEFDSIKGQISAYSKLGSVDVLESAMQEAEDKLSQYKEFGTTEQLTEAFSRIDQLVEDSKKLGSPDEIEESLCELVEYNELGSIEDLKTKLDTLAKFEEAATLEEVNLALSVVESYKELGTPELINKAFDIAQGIVEDYKTKSNDKIVEEISTEFEVSKETVGSLLKKHSKDEVKSILESIKSSKDDVSTRYRKRDKNKLDENVSENTDGDNRQSKIYENDDSVRTRGSRLMESLSR